MERNKTASKMENTELPLTPDKCGKQTAGTRKNEGEGKVYLLVLLLATCVELCVLVSMTNVPDNGTTASVVTAVAGAHQLMQVCAASALPLVNSLDASMKTPRLFILYY